MTSNDLDEDYLLRSTYTAQQQQPSRRVLTSRPVTITIERVPPEEIYSMSHDMVNANRVGVCDWVHQVRLPILIFLDRMPSNKANGFSPAFAPMARQFLYLRLGVTMLVMRTRTSKWPVKDVSSLNTQYHDPITELRQRAQTSSKDERKSQIRFC